MRLAKLIAVSFACLAFGCSSSPPEEAEEADEGAIIEGEPTASCPDCVTLKLDGQAFGTAQLFLTPEKDTKIRYVSETTQKHDLVLKVRVTIPAYLDKAQSAAFVERLIAGSTLVVADSVGSAAKPGKPVVEEGSVFFETSFTRFDLAKSKSVDATFVLAKGMGRLDGTAIAIGAKGPGMLCIGQVAGQNCYDRRACTEGGLCK